MSTKKKSSPKKVSKAKPSTKLVPPRIGEYWKGQGGVYAGIRRLVEDGVAIFYHLIVGPVSGEGMTFNAAGEWIAAVTVDGHYDFERPNQGDGRLIAANLDSIKTDAFAFWLTQHAAYESYAWCQDFYYGSQSNWLKDTELRARAVRRLTI